MFRALVFSNSKDLSKSQIEILKTYLDCIEDEVITVINYEDGKEFKFLNKEMSLVFETFLYGDYKDIPYCENKSIIDIGANVGDTAIYFANKGYIVYAFEPLPHICDIANKNLSLNPQYKDKITFINKAVSCKKGSITINFNPNDTAGASEFSNSVEEIQVETVTINDIIEEYAIEPNILKIDCEGCEVNIIKHSDLSMFKEIIMEYHTNVTKVDENILIDILKKQGFKLKNQLKYKHNGMGIIHMIK